MPSEPTLHVSRRALTRYAELVLGISPGDVDAFLEQGGQAQYRELVRKIQDISIYGRTLTPLEVAIFTPMAAKICAEQSIAIDQALPASLAPWGRYSLLNGVCSIENGTGCIVTVLLPTDTQMNWLKPKTPSAPPKAASSSGVFRTPRRYEILLLEGPHPQLESWLKRQDIAERKIRRFVDPELPGSLAEVLAPFDLEAIRNDPSLGSEQAARFHHGFRQIPTQFH